MSLINNQKIIYSIIVVSLNAGEELLRTLESILVQTEGRYEIILKDGFSTDGSIEGLPEDERIHLYQEKDKGIYDAMNQAVSHAIGEYYLFMNCGDYFYDKDVLQKVTTYLQQCGNMTPDIIYGNLYNRNLKSVIYASPVMNDFTCYRNVPCHQTCFYKKHLFSNRGYDTGYRVRADYEHFLWCYFSQHATTQYMDVIIANYEGGGFSETKENLKASAREHQEIVIKYMGWCKVIKFRFFLLITLAPLRRKLAESDRFSVWYNKVKTSIYKLRMK